MSDQSPSLATILNFVNSFHEQCRNMVRDAVRLLRDNHQLYITHREAWDYAYKPNDRFLTQKYSSVRRAWATFVPSGDLQRGAIFVLDFFHHQVPVTPSLIFGTVCPGSGGFDAADRWSPCKVIEDIEKGEPSSVVNCEGPITVVTSTKPNRFAEAAVVRVPLALADSIAQKGWDLNDQVNRYIAWWRQGEYSVNGTCFDIGTTTRSALVRFLEYEDAQRSGLLSEDASGNGSIMRLAPVPIRYLDYFPDRIEDLADLAEESSMTTHASEQCLSACRYMAVVLCGLMHGLNRDDVLSPAWGPLTVLRAAEPLHPAIDEVALGSFRERQPPQIKGSGYVVRSLEAALWAFHDAADFREAVLRAVNLGNDSDTTAAVCGQFAGAHWGESGIPEEWRDELAQADMIEKALVGLLSEAQTGGS